MNRALGPISKKLKSFSFSKVRSTTKCYNKAFHAKLFTLFASSESEVYTFAKRHTPHYDFCFAFMKDDEGQWYLDAKGILRVRKWVIQQAKKNPDSIYKLHAVWKKDWENYLKLSNVIKNKQLGKLSDLKLYRLFKDFYSQYLAVGSVAYISDSFMSTGTEDWLETLIADELAGKGIKKPERMALVRKLTSPVHLSFSLEAEYQLLNIARTFSKFSSFPSMTTLKKKWPLIAKKLERQEARFHWVQNNYYNVRYITADTFYHQIVKFVKETRKKKSSINALLQEKEEELRNLKEERQRLVDSLGLSEFTRNILRIASLFAKWKDIRKSGVYMGMYYFDLFLNEIAQRTHYTKSQLTFTVFNEIKDILLEQKNLHEEIALREKQCFFSVTPLGYTIVSGKDANRFFKGSLTDKKKNVTEIRGVVASTGYARGRVRIIKKTHDMDSFKTGEILVTNQTTPDFVPIMKKAAAIITEQGGITSHAAVVSRELKKPCIIGTKVATSVLMEGNDENLENVLAMLRS